ncbi:MAG: VWA domain-containing protein, partial [Victivallales bacterium]|nr:VWA domain-containing protein [Victivallales bacterium]
LHTADETLAKQLKKNKTDYHIKSKVIILLTDGENNVGRKVESVIDLAVKCGVRVHVIGVSGNGMMVVQTPFGRKKLPVRQPQLDTRELEALASKTGGTFQMATTAERLLEIYGDIDKMERTQIESIRFVDYKELFQPLALTALGLVVLKLLLEASLFRRLP